MNKIKSYQYFASVCSVKRLSHCKECKVYLSLYYMLDSGLITRAFLCHYATHFTDKYDLINFLLSVYTSESLSYI